MTAVLGACALLAVFVSGAGAGPPKDTQCAGALAGAYPGNIVAVGPCDLTAVTSVGGDVRVQPGASLSIGAGSTITVGHDITSTKALYIDIQSGTVLDDVRLDGTTGDTTVSNLHVVDDFEAKKSTAFILLGPALAVDGNARLTDNKGNDAGSSLIQLSESVVGGNVDVHGNKLDGDSSQIVISNGAFSGSGPASIGHDLAVHDNELSGASSNLVFILGNDVFGGNSDIRGNKLTGADNTVEVQSNNLGHDLHVADNKTSVSGLVDVSDNHVGHNLDCHGNKPPAASSSPNFAPDTKGGEGCVVLPPV